MADILGFHKQHRWLSNFHPCTISFNGHTYPTVENAYQAAKAVDVFHYPAFIEISPHEAKTLGQQIKCRPDWDDMKVGIMTTLVLQKFTVHDDLTQKLLDTGNGYLEETNHWKDVFWGVYEGQGQNMLGKILMETRTRLQAIAQGA